VKQAARGAASGLLADPERPQEFAAFLAGLDMVEPASSPRPPGARRPDAEWPEEN
jgi:hypothetical protein